jgi:hypothetical protein
MHRCTRAIVTTGAVAIALTLAAAPASASRRLRVAPAGAITAVSEGAISVIFNALTYRCNRVTLTGEVAREFDKTTALPAGRMGQIDTGVPMECAAEGGAAVTVVFLMERNAPSTLLYQAFLGTLPEITGVLFVALSFRFSVGAGMVRCLFQGMLGALALFPPSVEGGGMRYTRIRVLAAPRLRSTDCVGEATVAGMFRLTPAQSLTLA